MNPPAKDSSSGPDEDKSSFKNDSIEEESKEPNSLEIEANDKVKEVVQSSENNDKLHEKTNAIVFDQTDEEKKDSVNEKDEKDKIDPINSLEVENALDNDNKKQEISASETIGKSFVFHDSFNAVNDGMFHIFHTLRFEIMNNHRY